MDPLTIYVDADACPVKDEVYRVAERLGLSTFHFVNRQVGYLIPAAMLMIATSFLPPRLVRRAALLVFLGGMALVIALFFALRQCAIALYWSGVISAMDGALRDAFRDTARDVTEERRPQWLLTATMQPIDCHHALASLTTAQHPQRRRATPVRRCSDRPPPGERERQKHPT